MKTRRRLLSLLLVSSLGSFSLFSTSSNASTFYLRYPGILPDAPGSSGTSTGPTGDIVFNTTGRTYWTVPTGVTAISFVMIGGGGGVGGSDSTPLGGGGGGGLGYANNIAVTPGQQIAVVVGPGGSYPTYGGGDSSIVINGVTYWAGGGVGTSSTSGAPGGGHSPNTSGGTGGAGGAFVGTTGSRFAAGGGGAGGYSGDGGAGGNSAAYALGSSGSNGNGGGGGGGGGGYSTDNKGDVKGGGGGGVGLYGQGANGAGGAAFIGDNCASSLCWAQPGTGGSGGATGSNTWPGGYGGGAAYSTDGAPGAVRIIWGPGRSFPNNAS